MHHAAARDQHLVATELVRVAGPRLISMFAADKCGRTPLDLAFNSEVVDFLEDGLAAATLQGSELCIVAPSNSDIEKLQGTTAAPPPTASIRASSPTTSSPSIEAFLKEEFSRLGNTATRMLDSSGSSASASLILRKLDAALTDILSALSKQAAFPETANDYVSMVSEECAVVPNDETIADLPGTFPVSHSQEFDQAPVPDSKIPQMVVTPTEDDDFSDAARVFPPNHGENAPVVRVLDGFIYTKLRVRGLGKLTPEVWTSGMSDSDSANEEDDRESTDLQSPSAASEEDIEVDEYEFV
ncbi:hypothetical protein M427DRAFT_150981 [Gonapodya prolifera JEL478]|uniref:Uncharacterized protein n=1 Tax=Gonapodya prolifera (strain JEL478) TaxID=1344416 RepID=A0A139AY35_GONPJ|nr:hypothetical protein M427DRAFT_150981 [Gonapodya prolifera JEL478]|eukprot:KXS21662.1 hypothetical protein M427DRAFT_150981 [Gonapodya prolifera JEL478]